MGNERPGDDIAGAEAGVPPPDARVRLLGEVVLQGPEATVHQSDFGGRRPLLAFAALALAHGRPVERDALAEVLWPDERMPRSWSGALRSVLSRLRVVFQGAGFGPDVLHSVGSAVVLFLAADPGIDVHEARSLLDGARAFLGEGLVDRARTASAEAASLLAAPFLAGVASTWADDQRVGLVAARADALETLAAADLASGQARRAVQSAEEAVRLAPLRETAARLLMSAHEAAGNPAEGLRAYDHLRRRLAEELGVRPSQATEALRTFLVARLGGAVPGTGSPAGHTDPVATHGTAPPGRPGGVAVPGLRTRRHFAIVGRDGALASLERWWERIAAGGTGVAVVAGEQGSGKTRLVAELAELADRTGRTGPPALVHGQCSPLGEGRGEPFGEAVWRWGHPRPEAEAEAGPAGTWPGRSPAPEDVAAWLEELASAGPVLVVVDDVHWATAATLDAIVTCARLATHDVGLVLTRREPPLTRTGPLPGTLTALASVQPVEHLHLAPLVADDVARLVAVAGDADLDRAGPYATALTRASGGNAFLVTEHLAHLARLGRLDHWPPPHALSSALPWTVREAVLARLGQLDHGDLAVLAHAAAGADVVDAVGLAEDAGFAPAYQAIAAGVRLGLLEAAGAGCFRFRHGLVHEALARRVEGSVPSGPAHLWPRAAAEAWQLDPAQAEELARRWAPPAPGSPAGPV